jgi:hypothetical protein
MAGCSGITGAGARCRAIAISGSDYCYAHHPDRAKARSRAARKGGLWGGRGRPTVELRAIEGKLEDLADDLLAGRVEGGVATVLVQIRNAQIRAIATGLKATEQEQILGRVEELEALLENQQQRGGRDAS